MHGLARRLLQLFSVIIFVLFITYDGSYYAIKEEILPQPADFTIKRDFRKSPEAGDEYYARLEKVMAESAVTEDLDNTTTTLPPMLKNTIVPVKLSKDVTEFPSVRYGPFCVYPRVYNSQKRNGTITMVTHSSANYFGDNLINMACKWDGQVSLAIFASVMYATAANDSSVENVIKKLHGLSACSRCLADSLHAHIFIYEPEQECAPIRVDLTSLPSCKQANESLAWFRASTPSHMYPINTARNLARLFHKCRYVLFADMEQEYSEGAEGILRNLTTMYDLRKEKLVLVVRRFEYDSKTTPPRTMKELKAAYRKTTYEFHAFFWAASHRVPLLRQWMNENNEINPHIVDIKNRSQTWEPMFVAPSDIPYHDEKLTYGMSNHVALSLHLCCAGYRFMIAPSVFNEHQGIRRASRGLTYQSQYLGSHALNKFYYRMAGKYPLTAKRCLKGRFRGFPPTTPRPTSIGPTAAASSS